MTHDFGFCPDNSEMTSDLFHYEFDDNLSPTSKEHTSLLSPEPELRELDWQFNETFQELSTVSEVPVSEAQPCSGGGDMTYSGLPPTSAYKDGSALANDNEAELSDMLNVAFTALDDTFPDGVLNHLHTTAPANDKHTTSATEDDMFAELLPTTITEASSQPDPTENETHHNEVANANPPVNTKQKSRKRSASTKPSNKSQKQRKVSIDSNDLVVEPKPHETEQQALRRVKNNHASRVFRSKRKSKLEVNTVKEEELVKVNERLRSELQSVMEVVSLLKEGLINKCNARNSK